MYVQDWKFAFMFYLLRYLFVCDNRFMCIICRWFVVMSIIPENFMVLLACKRLSSDFNRSNANRKGSQLRNGEINYLNVCSVNQLTAITGGNEADGQRSSAREKDGKEAKKGWRMHSHGNSIRRANIMGELVTIS